MIGKKAWGGLKPLNRICHCRWIAVCTVVVAMSASLAAQTLERPGRITQEIDSTRVIPLRGSVRADVAAAPDLGPVEDELPLRLYMVLKRSPEQQAELDNLLARQQQPTAPEYHQWLTPQEFGARFGASPADIAKITWWLESRGLRVNGAMNNHMFIDFSATAGQVREVFRTEMHYFNIRGGKHAANTADPMIPAALAPVVGGIKGLNKIPPRPMHTKPGHASYDLATHRWKKPESENGPSGLRALPAFNDGVSHGFEEYDVAPQDYYTIYNVNQVYGNGNLGANATVAVVEESDFEYGSVDPSTGVATGGDLSTFRSLFGVPGTLNMHVYHGYGSVTCSDPGIDPANQGEELEAALDAEWANALAPSANLIFMSCASGTDQGTFTSMSALIDNNLADVMSLSYGESELEFTAADYAAYDALYSAAAAQGQTIIISSGDSGSDVADQNAQPGPPSPATTSYCPNPIYDTTGTAVCGLNVNAFASSPNVTSAGGTDFSDLYDWSEENFAQASNCVDGSTTCTTWGSAYWSSSNSPYYADALGYVPETTWNESCASSILANFANRPGYTGAGYCAALTATTIGGTVVGGSGGFSTHYGVPAYQSGITGYAGTKRAQPDISGFASDGFWNHALIFCDSYGPGAPGYPATGDPNAGNAPCTASSFGLAGGTSFVAPSLAGVTGLLVTATGSRQGPLNPALYALAKAQFTASATKSACYSNGQTSNVGITTGLPNSSACIFNDVTTGNNDVPCAAGSTNCYVNSGASYGMLSVNGAGSLKAAYAAGAGYDEATGIGTLNVYNLITKWNTVFPSTTVLSANPTTIAANGSTTLTATVTGKVPAGETYTPALSGSVNFMAGATALGSCTVSGGGCTLQVNGSALQSGANSVTATFVSGSYATSTSSIVNVTVELEGTTTTVTASPSPIALGSSSSTQSLKATVNTTSGTPIGTVTFKVGSVIVGSVPLSSGSAALNVPPTTANGFTVGKDIVTASYAPATGSGFIASSGTQTLSVTAPAYTITPSSASVSLNKGGAQADTITLASTTFADNTTWTVTTSSPLITVSPSSGTATLSANGSSTVSLTITASSSAANHAPRLPWTGGLIAFGVVLAGVPLAQRRKRVVAVLLTALAISTLGFLMSCGGGGGSGNTPPASPRSYTVTISGTGGISSTIAVTVQ